MAIEIVYDHPAQAEELFEAANVRWLSAIDETTVMRELYVEAKRLEEEAYEVVLDARRWRGQA
jgi:hypothetical protein